MIKKTTIKYGATSLVCSCTEMETCIYCIIHPFIINTTYCCELNMQFRQHKPTIHEEITCRSDLFPPPTGNIIGQVKKKITTIIALQLQMWVFKRHSFFVHPILWSSQHNVGVRGQQLRSTPRQQAAITHYCMFIHLMIVSQFRRLRLKWTILQFCSSQ